MSCFVFKLNKELPDSEPDLVELSAKDYAEFKKLLETAVIDDTLTPYKGHSSMLFPFKGDYYVVAYGILKTLGYRFKK